MHLVKVDPTLANKIHLMANIFHFKPPTPTINRFSLVFICIINKTNCLACHSQNLLVYIIINMQVHMHVYMHLPVI